MYDRDEVVDVTCAESVAPSAYVEVPLNFTVGILVGFQIVIPDGHSGLTGIALGYGHQPTVPWTAGAFFSGNDEVITRYVRDKVPGVPWSAFLCNQDLQAHSWEVRFMYDELDATAILNTVTAISAADIYAAASTTVNGD